MRLWGALVGDSVTLAEFISGNLASTVIFLKKRKKDRVFDRRLVRLLGGGLSVRRLCCLGKKLQLLRNIAIW